MSVDETLDDLTEIVTETAELVTEVSQWRCGLSRKQHAMQLILLGAGVGAVVSVVAYKVAERQLKTKYEKIAEKEIAEAKEFYSTLHKKGKFATPENAAKELLPSPTVVDAAEALLKYQGQDDEGEAVEPEEEETVVIETSTNVFVQRASGAENEIDPEDIAARTEEHPYIISQEEFMTNEDGFEQNSITYYLGDGTLADERDQEIPFVDPIVGEENLTKFGYGSGDARILYIRNERLSIDFEIALSDGKFSHEVLGFEHSDGGSRARRQRNQPHKFRGGDE